MGQGDWYRNKNWNDVTEKAFGDRLSRARDKFQYLRIQASYLTSNHPRSALKLLDQYFALGDHFDHAQAFVHCAEAYLALGNIPAAVASYESALAREAQFPKLLTQAYLALPVLIAEQRLVTRYSQAVSILNANETRLMFPLDRYLWHGTHALILHEQGDGAAARAAASLALVAMAERVSGFRYHPTVGLVRARDSDFDRRVALWVG